MVKIFSYFWIQNPREMLSVFIALIQIKANKPSPRGSVRVRLVGLVSESQIRVQQAVLLVFGAREVIVLLIQLHFGNSPFPDMA